MSDPVRREREPTPEAASALALKAPPRAVLELLRNGELDLLGRLSMASNASFYAALRGPDPSGGSAPVTVACVYKPIRGERPLDDFPDGTLAFREVAAFTVSEAAGWGIVPPSVLRDGPYGLGMVQLWLDPDEGLDPVALIRAGAPACAAWPSSTRSSTTPIARSATCCP